MVQTTLVAIAAILFNVAVSSPVCSLNPRSTAVPVPCTGDAPFTIAENLLYSNIDCVGGVENVKGPVALLVPGTGNTAKDSWDPAYLFLLGKVGSGLGFDVCYISPPPSMMDDIQLNAQYVVYASRYLAHKSGAPLSLLLGWSQGNLASQFALTFSPSIRSIQHFVSFAGDFRGSNILNGGVVSTLPASTPVRRSSTSGSSASVMQQSSTSHLLAALSRVGGLATWVPTTSIYSQSDQVIQPENATPAATSYLKQGNRQSPVSNVYIQQYCPFLPYAHEDHLFTNLSYQILKLALASSNGVAAPSAIASAFASGVITCDLRPAPGLAPTAVVGVDAALAIAVSNFAQPAYWVDAEPALQPYVIATPSNPNRGTLQMQ